LIATEHSIRPTILVDILAVKIWCDGLPTGSSFLHRLSFRLPPRLFFPRNFFEGNAMG